MDALFLAIYLVGSRTLSYLKVQPSAQLQNCNVVLFADLSKDGSAFCRWSLVAHELVWEGLSILVSNYLEKRTTDAQRTTGFDLADYILEQ